MVERPFKKIILVPTFKIDCRVAKLKEIHRMSVVLRDERKGTD